MKSKNPVARKLLKLRNSVRKIEATVKAHEAHMPASVFVKVMNTVTEAMHLHAKQSHSIRYRTNRMYRLYDQAVGYIKQKSR